ncbi:MAG TPA: peroxide stress protein YaaA [Mycobacteriales bacterium]|nr:peroxide stress protein YaaA [Mycobacteriales bacterium]
MLVLLPPSEGKATPADGSPLDLGSLTFPDLAKVRRDVLRELVRLCRGNVETALSALGLSAGQRDSIIANRALTKAPTIPAAQLYNGVLHSALGATALSPAARCRVLVFSGLFGAVGCDDRLPRYRLPIGARMARPLAGLWREALTGRVEEMAGDGLVVDLRSAPYAAAWRPSPEVVERTVVVSVLAEREVGGRLVIAPVSHFNKAAKGRFARQLLLRPTDDPAELPGRAAAAGLRGEVVASSRGYRLDLVEPWEAP